MESLLNADKIKVQIGWENRTRTTKRHNYVENLVSGCLSLLGVRQALVDPVLK